MREAPRVDPAPHPEELARQANHRLRRTVLLAAVSVVLLSVATALSFWDVVALPTFYVLLPGLALAQLPLLRIGRIERLPVYLGSSAMIVLLGAAALALSFRLEGGPPRALALPAPGDLLLWSGALTLAGLAILGPLSALDRGDSRRILAQLLPRSGRERLAFAVLSLCAGFGEELAYRGYALSAIQLLGPGPWVAAALSAAAFGLLHAYQGLLGTLRTAATGFVFAIPVVTAGSLVPSIVAHAVVDLVGGLVIGPRMLDSGDVEDDSSVASDPPPLVQPDSRE